MIEFKLRGTLAVLYAAISLYSSLQVNGDPSPDPKFVTDTAGGGDLTVSISPNGEYRITAKGVWLQSAPAYFHANNRKYSQSDGSLRLIGSDVTEATDNIGRYRDTGFRYELGNTNLTVFTDIVVYKDLPIILFYQYFLQDVAGTQAESVDGLCGGFPGFQLEGQPNLLGYLSYGGSMFGDSNKKMGTWYYQSTDLNDGITGGPLAIFDRQGNTVVLSPFNNFMSASFFHDRSYGGNFYAGIMGGAYYYYHTEPTKAYDATLIDVKRYADKEKIPYCYFQYDSWWYYKGVGGGVKTWTSRPDVFPEGFANVTEQLSIPAAAHNRYWSSDTTYAKQNGGKYDFIVEKTKALPCTKEFWMDLFTKAKKWGLILYEQDWLNVEFAGLEALLTNLTLGNDWLEGMAQAAEAHDLFIQYCMSNPRHAMSALNMSAVTQARVSGDYHPGKDQWKIGISSIFAAAMGVAPFKDTFWTTETQPGNKYNMTEPYWKLNSLVATLSTGPVGPGDMIGGTNRDILMKCCNPSGLILKPQFPARAIDAQIMQAAFGNVGGPEGEVWVSYTEINGLRFANLLGVDFLNGTEYTVHPPDLGIYDDNDTLYTVPYDDPYGWGEFSSLYGVTFTDQFKPDRPALYHISPNIPGWFMTTLFGELDKWVPMSPQRVTGLTWTNESVIADLQGVPGETVTMWYLMRTKGGSVLCTMSAHGNTTLVMDGNLGDVTCKT